MRNKTRRIRNWTGGFLAVFVLLVISAVTLTPPLLKNFYANWLTQQGLNGTIGNINIQLGYGRVTVEDIRIARQDRRLLKLDRLIVQLRMRDLADNRITVETVEVNGLDMQVNQTGQSLSIAGIDIQNNEPAPKKTTGNDSPPWAYAINNIRLNGIKSCFYQTSAPSNHKLHVCQSLDSVVWKGDANYQPDTTGKTEITVKGDLSINNMELVDAANNLIISRLGKLYIENIQIDSMDSVQVSKIALHDYVALQQRAGQDNSPYAMQWQGLTIDKLSLAKQQTLSVNTVQLVGLGGYIKVTKDRSLAPVGYLQTLLPATKSEPATRPAAEPDKTQFSFDIKQVSLKSDKTINIEDNSVQPAILHSVRSLDITLNNINNSEKNNYSPLQADIGIGKYGHITLAGKLQLFADKPGYMINGKIKGIDLAELSVYSKELLQHHIQSGHLDADLDIRIAQGQLDSKAVVKLHKFYVNKLDQKEQDKYQKSLGIPLSAALSLLRDKDDRVSIELPVSGDTKNPDFSLNDIISTVSAKAIKVAIINYYASFGLIAVVGKVFDLATALRFEPVVFNATETALDTTAHSQLDKLATMLNERPQVHLVLCGHVTQQDQVKLFPFQKDRNLQTQKNFGEDSESSRSATKTSPASLSDTQLDQLIGIARQRGENVKAYLVKNTGIEANRLILCNPEYKPDDSAQPYVEIRI